MYAAHGSGMASLAVAVLVVSLLLPPPLLPSAGGGRAAAQQELGTMIDEDDEAQFSYRRDAGDGPERWGLIRREWATCSTGHMQSPIGLSDAVAGLVEPRHGRLRRTLRPASASIVNRGHDIMVRFRGDAGGVVVDGAAYRLRQMHWHAPSEHAINGRRYDLELHMLHQSADGANKYVAVAQLYRIGRHRDKTLHRLERYIRRIARREDEEELIDDMVDPRRPIRGSNVFYRYTGSFTTPPCTEGITWLVAQRVRRVRRRQVNLLRHAVHDGARGNARPLQPANGRALSLYYSSPALGDGQ
ncbi:hypothetical protein ACP70R_044201 [Stipagrostis hirtigluma subsp. patula]